MDRIQQELAKTDQSIPFRASTSHVHYTWAKTFSSKPELYLRPRTLPEIQKIVNLARKCRRRIVVVGCGHSPSTLTCTSSWMVNLDDYRNVLKVDKEKKRLVVEGGIRLRKLNDEANAVGLTIPNLGSIDEQSIVGAIATATHGSSLKHGLLSENVRSLRIVLANGQAVRCSAEQNQELFRAALVSLGALGIIVEVEYQMTEAGNIEWTQTLEPLSKILGTWNTSLWTQKEYTRVWWMPYMNRAIVWSASKSSLPLRAPEENFYGGSIGFHTYHNLLYLSNYIPFILPWVEWFVFGMQYGFRTGQSTSAVEPLRTGLLMNCLYSQFVNEWALPLSQGPEAIERLSRWINAEGDNGRIPFSNRGLYVHCPIEVRVSDTSRSSNDTPRPYLDNTNTNGPTLYLNATLYRPYLQDPPCKDRYYEAFEWLMREMGAKPHYAKNWQFTSSSYIESAFGSDLTKWTQVRNEADPEGMFVGEWHRQALGLGSSQFALEEKEVDRSPARPGSCMLWRGSLASTTEPSLNTIGAEGEKPAVSQVKVLDSPTASSTSAESFDMMHAGEAEKSVLYGGVDEEGEETDRERDEKRYHGQPRVGVDGVKVFDKINAFTLAVKKGKVKGYSADDDLQLTVSCFNTSVILRGANNPGLYFMITGVLLDSGASGNFIKRQAVVDSDLPIYQTEPINFTMADGRKTMSNEYVFLNLNVSGINVRIKAFVADNGDPHTLLLGTPFAKHVLLGTRWTLENVLNVTIAERDENCNHRVKVWPNERYVGTEMRTVTVQEALGWAEERNVTIGDYKRAQQASKVSVKMYEVRREKRACGEEIADIRQQLLAVEGREGSFAKLRRHKLKTQLAECKEQNHLLSEKYAALSERLGRLEPT